MILDIILLAGKYFIDGESLDDIIFDMCCWLIIIPIVTFWFFMFFSPGSVKDDKEFEVTLEGFKGLFKKKKYDEWGEEINEEDEPFDRR